MNYKTELWLSVDLRVSLQGGKVAVSGTIRDSATKKLCTVPHSKVYMETAVPEAIDSFMLEVADIIEKELQV